MTNVTTINSSKKWSPIILEKEISCSQWEGSTCTHDGPMFFLLGGVGWRGVSYYYYFFLGQMGRLEEKIAAVLLY